MIEYILVMALFAVAASIAPQRKPNWILWSIAFVVLVMFVGLRHKVGMDWNNYLVMSSRLKYIPVAESLEYAEPAYAILLWLSTDLGAGVYGVNLVGATVLMLGIFRFASRTPLPWLAIVTSLPILVVVVGMSANRQAVAIGVLMWLVAGWEESSLRTRLTWILVASLFHFSSIFFLMFAALGLQMKPVYKLVLAVVLVSMMVLFLQATGGAEYYDQLYVSGQTEETYSSGAIMHVMLNGLPALFVFASARFRRTLLPSALLVQMAWVSVSLVPLALIFSAASGRMTLYLFPVSMYVFSALPSLFANSAQRAGIRTFLSVAMFLVLWIWLNYANSSLAHIPYRNVLWMDASELHL